MADDGPAGTFQRSLKGEDHIGSEIVKIGTDFIQFLHVADGHGGDEVAELCHAKVIAYTVAEAGDDPSSESLTRAFERSFDRLQTEVLMLATTAGTTLTVAAVNQTRSELTVANVGDSAALLVFQNSETLLTADHRLEDSAEERERVIAAGCKIGRALNSDGIQGGPLRAWPGGLALCRTIGDADCPAAIATPSVHSTCFDAQSGAALVVCSDGVWDALSICKAAVAVRQSKSTRTAAERLVQKAISARGLRDDTSAIALWLGIPPWDGSMVENQSTRSRLSNRLSFAFRSRSPSGGSSASSTPVGSPMGSPVASHNNLEALGAALEGLENTSAPPQALKVAL
mmetsp:Transcript_47181/g.93977  ORF Transcript_47181/g.93977 Transcript_47181/m.93977 type:complete len:343 (-) Transcript_47181:178-1206(-)|eukprot:CAMPEP_0174730684 /NCGR_PEP_ID=MMETSP1094-20130205/56095_1 /TAXON_ID=156173 /ORGANISM="Chrysochromulina brevifilum, Strain UTEX LB 985" /LENGTH=342 /DNA_ID=CAMNT_0015932971 /DNA_START=49 /DNA_END=1077 /DNA_ORIENTATION=+